MAQWPDTATHVVRFDNGVVAWWDGATKSMGGHLEVMVEAYLYSTMGWPVRLGQFSVGANLETPLGIAGALAAYEPGRVFFEVVPDEVAEYAFDE